MYNFNPIGYQVAYTNFALNQLQSSPMTPPLTPPTSIEGSEANSSPNSSNTSEHDSHLMKTTDSSKIKRTRTAFTNDQLMDLEREFQRSVYLDRTRRIGIAERLGLMDKQVKVWFQNRRMKSKKSIIPNGNRVVKPHQAHHGIVKRLMSFTQDPNNVENMKPPNRVTTAPQTTVQMVQKKMDIVPPKPLPLPVLKPMAAQLVTGPVVQFQQQTKPFKPQLIIQLPVTGRPHLQQIPNQNTSIVPKTENVTQQTTVRQLRTDMPTTSKNAHLQHNPAIPTNQSKPQQPQQVVYRPVLLTYPNQQGQLHQPRNVPQVQQQHFNCVPTSGSNQAQKVQIQQVQQALQQNVSHYQNGIVPQQLQCQESHRQPEEVKMEKPQPEQNPTLPDLTRSKTPEDLEMDLYESLILSLDSDKELENTSYSVDLSAILDNLISDAPNSQTPIKTEKCEPEQSQQQVHVHTAQQDQQLNIEVETLQQIKIETDDTQIKVEQQENIKQHQDTMPMDFLEDIKPMSFGNFMEDPKPEDYDFDLDDFVESLDKYTNMSYLNSSQDPMLGHTSQQDHSFSFNSSAIFEPYASTSQLNEAAFTPPDSSFNFEPAVPIVNISFDDCMDPQSSIKEPIITYSF